MNCETEPMVGTSFCPECGAPTTPSTEICTECGVQLAKATKGRTWKVTTAGILTIVSGGVGVTVWVAIAVLEIRAWGWLPTGGPLGPGGIVPAAVTIVIAIGIAAIVGGIFALKRKRWKLALAGSICGIFPFFFVPLFLNVPLAIAAIVLVVLGKGEFE